LARHDAPGLLRARIGEARRSRGIGVPCSNRISAGDQCTRARGIVQDILNYEYRRVSFFYRRLGFRVVDIYDRPGRGLRYSLEGDFIGFLEPPR
jgi:hypothetical protein